MATKKKGFGSAADAFLGVQLPVQENSTETKEEVAETAAEPVMSEVSTPKKSSKKELKSKSVLLKLTPSLYEKVKAQAEEEGLGFNTYVTTLLVKAVK